MPESIDQPDPPSLQDSDLRAELARLWLDAQPAVTGLIRAMVSNPSDRDDLIQATAMAVARDFGQYEHDRSFTAWAVGIARYRVLSYYRDHQRDRHVFSEKVVGYLAEAAAEIAPRLSDREVALEACMSKLKQDQRRLLELRYADDIEVSVLADRIGVTPNTLAVSLGRIRKALADCIEHRLSNGST